MVKQEVIVHVQLVEHPAQGVLADGKDAGVKPCRGKDMSQLPCLLPSFLPPKEPQGPPSPPPPLVLSPSTGPVSAAFYQNMWWWLVGF